MYVFMFCVIDSFLNRSLTICEHEYKNIPPPLTYRSFALPAVFLHYFLHYGLYRKVISFEYDAIVTNIKYKLKYCRLKKHIGLGQV